MKKYRSILIIILMCLLVLVVGTYAWLSWRSNETGLKLTIGSIDDVRVTISPYKIDSNIIPILSYEEEEYSHIEVINNSAETKNLELYYKINNIDEELISEDFMYTIEKSIDGVTYSKHKEGNFIEVTTESEFVILTESIPTNTEYEYRVYVWLNGENHDQGSFVGKKFSGELRGKIPEYVSIFEEYTYEEISANYSCGSGDSLVTIGNPIFTYTGDCEVVDDGDSNWKVRLLTSGDFISKSNLLVDAFLVGGGGGGGSGTSHNDVSGGGGGGGYTTTTFVNVNANTNYSLIIGDGGEIATNGESTIGFNAIAVGGEGGIQQAGGSGGSGGGGYVGGGGSNGSSGGGNGGVGQRITTCEFGESGCSSNLLYSGGGGGGGGLNGGSGESGGSGGGGSGGSWGENGTGGSTNTGGGGGGGGGASGKGSKGGSGIIVIRNYRGNYFESLPSVGFDFTYTGTYTILDDGDGNWRIKFLTSGIFTSSIDMVIDAFLVGGGGGGGNGIAHNEGAGGGGGGGYTNTTIFNIKANTNYNLVIGNGGKKATNGEETTGFNAIAFGGEKGLTYTGGSGGAGGGGYASVGGGNGSNGNGTGGTGQGITTCEFGESGCSSDLQYSAGGGGGGGLNIGYSGESGGIRGGGRGGDNYNPGTSAIVNSGSGGGGGGANSGQGAAGGSGIVIIRNHRGNESIEQLPGVGFDFEYTGNYTVINDGNNNWRIKFLTSGTFTSSKNLQIDVFLVGGGGGGSSGISHNDVSGGGGGGGYTLTSIINIKTNQLYDITVGSGGSIGNKGGDTTAFNLIAEGGTGGSGSTGGSGGSGGGGYVGVGGSNGNNGGGTGGTGQGRTTCEFAEDGCSSYLQYSAGGGGGGGLNGGPGESGGSRGGGIGGDNYYNGTSGIVNTGSGGGGGGSNSGQGAAGGSGIVIIRNKR